jgi:hypothetical protein
LLRHGTKNPRPARRPLHRPQTAASTIIDKGSPTSIRQDKQMPNTALALVDAATEPAIAVEATD